MQNVYFYRCIALPAHETESLNVAKSYLFILNVPKLTRLDCITAWRVDNIKSRIDRSLKYSNNVRCLGVYLSGKNVIFQRFTEKISNKNKLTVLPMYRKFDVECNTFSISNLI